jgi:hypothetical protein
MLNPVIKALRKAFPFVLIIVAVAALYGQFLNNPIVFDDIYFFVLDKTGAQAVSDYHLQWLERRSLPNTTLAWTKAWFGLDMSNFRAGNLIAHALVSCVLYGFLAALFTATQAMGRVAASEDSSPDRFFSPNAMALLAALLFAVHPVATYAVGYLVQRSSLFAAFFGLLAMWCWVCGTVKSKDIVLWLAVPLYYLAVFSKEHVVMLVAVLPLLTVVLRPDWRQRLWCQRAILLALAVVAALVVNAHTRVLGATYEPDAGLMLSQPSTHSAYLLSVLTQTTLFFKYIGLWLLPLSGWMSIDMRESFATGFSTPYVLGFLAFISWGAAGAYLLLQRGKWALLGFAILFPWLMFMTELTTVRIQEVFVLYRSYLWMLGALCALPVILQRLPYRYALALSLAAVITLVPISLERLLTMASPILLWDDAAKLVDEKTEPIGAARIYYNRGTEYLKGGWADKAISDLQRAATLRPDFWEAYNNLAYAYYKNHDWSHSEQAYTHALSIAAKRGLEVTVPILNQRAGVYELLGEVDKAQAGYRQSCQMMKLSCDKVH